MTIYPWEHLGAFDLDCFERIRIQAEQVEDRRRDLGRLDPGMVRARLHRSRRIDDDRHVTIGWVGTALPDDASDATTLVRSADRALYSAKKNGRDRIETVVPEEHGPLPLTTAPNGDSRE